MKIGCFEIINVEKRVREIYDKYGKEEAYLAFRIITGADFAGSHKAVKKLLIKNNRMKG